MTDPVTPEAITAAAQALATHRWKSMGIASVECECGEIISGQSIAIGPSFDPDGPGYETAAFPADEAFRRHLAAAVLEAATAADPTTETEGFRAYKAGLAAGRTEGAAAERERILVPDETVHADGSIGPDAVPPGLSPDPAYWYRRWLFALKMLDNEASERICGWPKAAAAEREAIIQLASQMRATIPADHPAGAQASFADYLRVTRPQPAAAGDDQLPLTGEGPGNG